MPDRLFIESDLLRTALWDDRRVPRLRFGDFAAASERIKHCGLFANGLIFVLCFKNDEVGRFAFFNTVHILDMRVLALFS